MSGIGVGLGMATGPVASAVGTLALNAADYFLIDTLLKGWRPSQFIEGPFRQFLSAPAK